MKILAVVLLFLLLAVACYAHWGYHPAVVYLSFDRYEPDGPWILTTVWDNEKVTFETFAELGVTDHPPGSAMERIQELALEMLHSD